MPELPEVEKGRKLAERHLTGKRIRTVKTVDDRIVYAGVTPRRFAAALRGRRVEAVHRRGKHLWMELDRRPWPLFHFGMTGSFQVYHDPSERPRFLKVELLMEDGIRLAMPNARRLGRIRLQHDPFAEAPIGALGWDPYLDLPSTRALAELLESRKAPIKALLLDQSLFAGVGNWIADEVLYQARIRPDRRAHRLKPAEVTALRTKLRHVIRKAVAVDADSKRFPRSWLFHRRWGKDREATTHRGEPLRFTVVGGRTTAWVPGVQR